MIPRVSLTIDHPIHTAVSDYITTNDTPQARTSENDYIHHYHVMLHFETVC